MKIAVLGTGTVGATIASKLVALGHDVMMGSRTAGNEKAVAWVTRAGPRAREGTFADAARFAEVVFNCTNGKTSVEAVRAAAAGGLDGKVVIDLTNSIPALPAGSLSLGEQIQQACPGARVVKSLNTINSEVMVDPGRLPGAHAVFMSGNDAAAKGTVRSLLESFGWLDVIDLGDITTARTTEGYLTFWLAVAKAVGSYTFNVAIVR
jgi:8-hydroxy-5-deazaflavin:NADPH oxidoreductase